MLIRHINSRDVIYIQYNTSNNWFSQLPNQNWLCVLVSDDRDRNYLDEGISKIINNSVCCLCCVGKQCELVNDLADEEIAFREVNVDKPYLPDHDIMTTWHADFEEGVWFSVIAAYHKEVDIRTVVILDMTSGQRIAEIQNALDKAEHDK
ncbi:hypothetical protein Slin_5575 [Spirosoma linguale DSM 74]|uniref:DUF7684 domain-containing protein n=2 Tax=Spirosoma TaxID=107 RepID=D2QRV9_SPILD|nr:hypothetical protein Slin_5575 [Spirosoma linguale DSM 74]